MGSQASGCRKPRPSGIQQRAPSPPESAAQSRGRPEGGSAPRTSADAALEEKSVTSAMKEANLTLRERGPPEGSIRCILLET